MANNRLLTLERGTSSPKIHTLEGTLQRVNYRTREMSVIADGQIWYFSVDVLSQLRFDDQTVILRCFHPLDQVRIEFAEGEPTHRLLTMEGWEKMGRAV